MTYITWHHTFTFSTFYTKIGQHMGGRKQPRGTSCYVTHSLQFYHNLVDPRTMTEHSLVKALLTKSGPWSLIFWPSAGGPGGLCYIWISSSSFAHFGCSTLQQNWQIRKLWNFTGLIVATVSRSDRKILLKYWLLHAESRPKYSFYLNAYNSLNIKARVFKL